MLKHDDIKFCKDCKWAENRRNWLDRVLGLKGTQYLHCANPTILKGDSDRYEEYLVMGQSDETPYCSVARIHRCGPEAKYWEAKDA